MTRNDDFIGQLEGYLDEYEGSTPLPDEVRSAIRAQLPSIQQRPAWWPARRFPSMNNTMRIGVAAAVLAVAAALGFSYLVAPNVGGPGLDDPSPTPSPVPLDMGDGVELAPGTYRLTAASEPDASTFREGATITVPDGWVGGGGLRVFKETPVGDMQVGFWCCDQDFATVYLDPCQWQDGVVEPPVGPTVDDLATALDNQAQRGDSTPIDVSIDGYDGKMIQLTVPSDIDFADCDAGEFRSWEGRFHQGPGQIEDVYILDVDGQRLVLNSSYFAGTSDADLAERQAVIDSIQLDTP